MRIMLDTNVLVSVIFFPSYVTRNFACRMGYGNRIVLCDRDMKDSPILATAMIENIDILVTGDKDLRVVESEYPEIMTMSEFVEKY